MNKLTIGNYTWARRHPHPIPEHAQCPDCGYYDTRDADVIAAIAMRPDVPLSMAECRCKDKEAQKKAQAYKELKAIWDKAGLPQHKDTGIDLHLGNFTSTRPGAEEAFAAVQAFGNGEGPAMLGLLGVPGSGKSHLAEAVVRYWINRYQVQAYYNNVSHLLERLRLANSRKTEEEAPQMLMEQKEASLVVLDDIGQNDAGPWVRRVLGDLVDYRYREGLWTLVTANTLDKEELGKVTDERIASRLWDTERSTVVTMTCGDYRALTSDERDWKEAVR